MTPGRQSFRKSLLKALAWVAGVSLFGVAPLIFLLVVNVLSEENVAVREIGRVIQDGYFVFVACAVTGSVLMNFIASPFQIRGLLQAFAIYTSPFCLLAYVLIKYLIIYMQYDTQHDPGAGSLATILIVVYSFVYCTLVKTIYYLKSENGYTGSR